MKWEIAMLSAGVMYHDRKVNSRARNKRKSLRLPQNIVIYILDQSNNLSRAITHF